jgi:hypothetical protein
LVEGPDQLAQQIDGWLDEGGNRLSG